MKIWTDKRGAWFVLLMLCVAWVDAGQAQSSEGKKVGWVEQLKRLYLSLSARIAETEEKFRATQTKLTKVESHTTNATNIAKSAQKEAEGASKVAQNALGLAKSVRERAKKTGKLAFAELRAAKLRAEKAERELKTLQKQILVQKQALQLFKKELEVLNQRSISLKKTIENGVGTLMRRAGARKVYRVGGVEFAVRWIPAGSFLMGSLPNESERDPDEGPQRIVHISKGFWIMESEVTQGLYKTLTGNNPCFFSSCGDTCPAEMVSWEDALVFANKLSVVQGLKACTSANQEIFGCRGWRLPTEAEWEYAARAGTTTAFHTGNCISADQANYDGGNKSVGCSKGVYRRKTIKVCSLAKNAWGLCDMHGNVWEWTMDWYKGSYAGLSSQDPYPNSGVERVRRGGGWNDYARDLRSANRREDISKFRSSDLGFRLVRYP